MSASEAMREAALEAIGSIAGVGAYDLAPVQAAFPYVEVGAGSERDWRHKSGLGREVRIAVSLRDEGERPARLRRLMAEAETLLAGINVVPDWQIVSMHFLRTLAVREKGKGGRPTTIWTGLVEFRARLLSLTD